MAYHTYNHKRVAELHHTNMVTFVFLMYFRIQRYMSI